MFNLTLVWLIWPRFGFHWVCKIFRPFPQLSNICFQAVIEMWKFFKKNQTIFLTCIFIYFIFLFSFFLLSPKEISLHTIHFRFSKRVKYFVHKVSFFFDCWFNPNLDGIYIYIDIDIYMYPINAFYWISIPCAESPWFIWSTFCSSFAPFVQATCTATQISAFPLMSEAEVCNGITSHLPLKYESCPNRDKSFLLPQFGSTLHVCVMDWI